MDFELDDERRLLRDTVRDFARGEVAPRAGELDRTKSFPYELVAQMGGLGLMGKGGTRTFAYDSQGRLEAYTDPRGKTWDFA